MTPAQTIYIVQTAFLGDVVLTLPLCAALRRSYPEAQIVFITTPMAADFLKGLSVADDVVAFDKRRTHRSISSVRALAASLRCTGPSVAIVPHKSLRTAIFVQALRADVLVTFKDAMSRWFATHTVEYPAHRHDVDRHMALLQPLFPASSMVPDSHSLMPIDLRTHDKQEAINVWNEALSAPRIVLAPATVWPTKQWPVEQMRGLAQRCLHEGYQVAVIGDASVHGCMDGIAGVNDQIGKTTLRQAATIIATADCVVANDSAPVHLASLQNVPVVAIFGPTVPEFGFGPLGQRSRVVQRGDLECRPCSSHGGRSCPIGTHECMTGISVDAVFSALQSTLAHDVNRHAKPNETTF
ncbi:MAG: glycosyltransferase family 9 protein [Candidatus Kapabacteria bacterium]|nr:glycosyltransferase family 9 protein [Candidatus Kapabacteria bacterium]